MVCFDKTSPLSQSTICLTRHLNMAAPALNLSTWEILGLFMFSVWIFVYMWPGMFQNLNVEDKSKH